MKVVVDLVFIETLIIFQCLSEINATKMTLTGNCIFHFKEEMGGIPMHSMDGLDRGRDGSTICFHCNILGSLFSF